MFNKSLKQYKKNIKKILIFLISMNFAIILLIFLSISSIIGTIIEQKEPLQYYINQFGPLWTNVFNKLELFNIYNSSWFIFLFIFILLSTLICIIKTLKNKENKHNKLKEKFYENNFLTNKYKYFDCIKIFCYILKKINFTYNIKKFKKKILIKAKKGLYTKFGYIITHLGIIIICIGSLLDSNIMIKIQSYFFNKIPTSLCNIINTKDKKKYQLPPENPSFHGYISIPEGKKISSIIIEHKDKFLIQKLPFSIKLKKFNIEYYKSGIPKFFSSYINIIENNKKTISSYIAVNKPLKYKNVYIYQSGFQDGGSDINIKVYPMIDKFNRIQQFKKKIGSSSIINSNVYQSINNKIIKFQNLKTENIKILSNDDNYDNINNKNHNESNNYFLKLIKKIIPFNMENEKQKIIKDIGPSIKYFITNKNGETYEYNNYMYPLKTENGSFFLNEYKSNLQNQYKYFKIPADKNNSINEWMLLRSASSNPLIISEAIKQFTNKQYILANLSKSNKKNLENNTYFILNLFLKQQNINGYQKISNFIKNNVPQNKQNKITKIFLYILNKSILELWQISRKNIGKKPVNPYSYNTINFIQNTINTLSDYKTYNSDIYIQLTSFKQKQASILQLTRNPGKIIVYTGSILLIFGIIIMFYISKEFIFIKIKDNNILSIKINAYSTNKIFNSKKKLSNYIKKIFKK